MKVIDLDSIPSYTKLDLACHQLDRAIKLFIDEHDYISTVTLSGAAEEISGKLLEGEIGTNEFKELIEECLELSSRTTGGAIDAKEFREIFTYHRNELKHIGTGADISISAACAQQFLDRAMQNLRRLSVTDSPEVQRYTNYRNDG